jgi:hypothetical protein
MPFDSASSTSIGSRVGFSQLGSAEKKRTSQGVFPLMRQTSSPPPRHRAFLLPNNDTISWNNTGQQSVRHAAPKNGSLDANNLTPREDSGNMSSVTIEDSQNAKNVLQATGMPVSSAKTLSSDNVQQVSTSPMQELRSGKEIISCVGKLRENMERWKLKFKVNTQIDCVRQNERYNETIDILGRFGGMATLGTEWRCLKKGSVIGCFEDKTPIGLLAISREKKQHRAYIELVVTHPDSRGIGINLIEQSVQLSKKWGFNGNIALRANNKSAKEFFLGLGFIPNSTNLNSTIDPSKDIILNPESRSDIWCQHKDEWRIKKYLE